MEALHCTVEPAGTMKFSEGTSKFFSKFIALMIHQDLPPLLSTESRI
jgi:hypothetical protein